MLSKDYQNELKVILKQIFPDQQVRSEWDSVQYDPHSSNHDIVYAPRHDLAIGPFTDFFELDIGRDRTDIMKKHPFTKKLYKDYLQNRGTISKIWNSKPRCFLAIEIEFSGSLKHMLGSIINAYASGSLAIIITKQVHKNKISRLITYLLRLEDYGFMKKGICNNLIVFSDEEFKNYLIKYLKHIPLGSTE